MYQPRHPEVLSVAVNQGFGLPGGHQDHSTLWVFKGGMSWRGPWGKCSVVLQKVKHGITYDLANMLQGMCPKELKTDIQTKMSGILGIT